MNFFNVILGNLLIMLSGLSVIIPLWYVYYLIPENELTLELGLLVIIFVTGVAPFSIIFGNGKLQNKSFEECLK